MSKNTYQYPFVVSVINRFVASLPEAKNLEWTSITINHGWPSSRHRDRNNVGTSIIFSVGRHRGGKLRTWPHDTCDRPTDELPTQGSVLIDPHRKPTIFDGTQCHETSPFTGERVNIICFKSRWTHRIGTNIEQALLEYLFCPKRNHAFVGARDPKC